MVERNEKAASPGNTKAGREGRGIEGVNVAAKLLRYSGNIACEVCRFGLNFAIWAKKRGPLMRIAIFTAIALLTGCVTTSRIVPAGKDTYMISAANDACGNCAPPQIRATEQASIYCAGMSKVLMVKDTREQTWDLGFGKRITLTFACVVAQ